MAHYQGTNAEGSRARTLANEREKQLELFKKQQDDIKKANQVKLQDMSQNEQTTRGGRGGGRAVRRSLSPLNPHCVALHCAARGYARTR